MTELVQAIFDRLRTDAALVAALGSYQSAPCIFLDQLVPPLAPRPYIWGPATDADEPWDTKRDLGRDVIRSLWCVTDATASPAVVRQMAEQVRNLFHRFPLTVAGYTTVVASCSGPVQGETDDTVRALIVTAHWQLQKL